MTLRQLSLQAMKEFAGYNDACGPNAEDMALAAVGAEPETLAEMTAIRSRDIARGWFTPGGGEPLSSMYLDLTTYERSVQVIQYIPFAQPGNWYGALRPALVQYAGIYPCAIEVGAAHNLWGNEQGVNWHFVLIAGINIVNGAVSYLLLNGDDIQALQGQTYYSGRWISEADLISADVAGLIVVGKKVSNPVGIPSGWKDSANGNPNNSAGVLTAPNGISVALGYRWYVLTAQTWDANNVPIEAAHGANPCNPTNAKSGGGTGQMFNYLYLFWQEGTSTIQAVPAGAVAEAWKSSGSNDTPPAPDPLLGNLRNDLAQLLAGK